MRRTRDQARADLLARVPAGTTRVLIKTPKGEQKYKAILDLIDSDEVQVNKAGEPIVMKGVPGRPSPLLLPPINPQVALGIQRKEAAMAGDPVLVRMKRDPDSAEVLHEVILGLGEEAASLRFERDEAAREGKETAGLSTKRVQALRAVGETWLKRMDQLANKILDLDSPAFEALFKYLMETLREATNAAKLRPEQVETVFAKFAALAGTEDWKTEAKNRMKHAN